MEKITQWEALKSRRFKFIIIIITIVIIAFIITD